MMEFSDQVICSMASILSKPKCICFASDNFESIVPLILNIDPMFTQGLREIYNAIYNVMKNQSPQPRWKICLEYLNGRCINTPGIMVHAVASMYVKNQNHFEESTKKSVIEMVEIIR